MIKFSRLHLQPVGCGGLLVVLTLGLCFVVVGLGLPFVMGVSSFWQLDSEDLTQYIAGFNMYFAAPWGFPLLAFDRLNYPGGTSVTFVDAIPLYAFLLKLLLPSHWAPFNPYGFWVGLCFTLQAVGAWWIGRELRVKSWTFLISLAIVLLAFPALMARVGHISLMSHWIILFAFALYIRSRRLQMFPIGAWAVLLVSAFYINIYLFAMASGIYLSARLSNGLPRDYRIWLAFLLPYVALTASLFVTLLPLPPGEVTREWGFGYYSMNLLSPLMGGSVFQVHASAAPGQYEGFNYLGVGIVIAFGMALRLQHSEGWTLVRRHWPLVVLLFAFTVYALSSQIYFSSVQILTVKYPKVLDAITSQFRASGRFFWPVGYAVAIFALLVLQRHLSRVAFVVTALILVSLQIVDLKERYAILQTTLAREPVRHLNPAAWDRALRGDVQTLYFYPKFKCGKHPAHDSLLPFMKYAAERGYNINTGYIARYTPRCDDISQEIAASAAMTSAYVFVQKEFDGLGQVRALLPPGTTLQCRELDFAYLCTPPN